MMVVSLVLFFLPGINGFLGGVIGGSRHEEAWPGHFARPCSRRS